MAMWLWSLEESWATIQRCPSTLAMTVRSTSEGPLLPAAGDKVKSAIWILQAMTFCRQRSIPMEAWVSPPTMAPGSADATLLAG